MNVNPQTFLPEEWLEVLQKAIEESRDGMVIADATKPGNPLIYVNKAFEEVTGYSKEESIGRNCKFLQGKDSDQPAIYKLKKAMTCHEAATVVVKNYKKDGTLFYNRLSITPLKDEQGDLKYFIGVQDDITENVKAQEKIQQLNTDLKQNNRQLKDTLDELTKAKISRRAVIYVLIFALFMFIVGEEVIDPFIDSYSYEEYLSLSFKACVALALKPIESIIEDFLTKRSLKIDN